MGPLAAADVQVASRNNQGVPWPSYIQMNTHYANLPRRGQVQVELELGDSPASLLLLHPDVEIQARSRSEMDRVALQLLNATCLLAELNRLLREVLNPPMIFLIAQVCPHPPQQEIRRIEIQFIKSRFEGILSLKREPLQLILDAQVGRPPERSSGPIWKTSVRRLRRLGAMLKIRSADFSSASSRSWPPSWTKRAE